MTVALTITTDKASYLSGETITITLKPTGIPADTPASQQPMDISAFVLVDGTKSPPAGAKVNLDIPAHKVDVQYGLSFSGGPVKATANPLVFTAVMP